MCKCHIICSFDLKQPYVLSILVIIFCLTSLYGCDDQNQISKSKIKYHDSEVYIDLRKDMSEGYIVVNSSDKQKQLPPFLDIHSRRSFHTPTSLPGNHQICLKMREIVHLQAGQCGNQIGSKVRGFLCVCVFVCLFVSLFFFSFHEIWV